MAKTVAMKSDLTLDGAILLRPVPMAVDAHLRAYGMKPELVRSEDKHHLLWAFTADESLSLILRYYQFPGDGKFYLLVEACFGLVDPPNTFAICDHLAKMNCSNNPSVVRVGISQGSYNSGWVAQLWTREDHITPNSVGELIDLVVQKANEARIVAAHLPGFKPLNISPKPQKLN